jgi:hypothetical protein
MMASSSTVLSNLAYLIGAVVLAVIGGLAVWLHHRQPKSVDANMASFRRGLNALAPDVNPGPNGPSRNEQRGFSIQPPPNLTHVRVERTGSPRAAALDSHPADVEVHADGHDASGELPVADISAVEGGGDPG